MNRNHFQLHYNMNHIMNKKTNLKIFSQSMILSKGVDKTQKGHNILNLFYNPHVCHNW